MASVSVGSVWPMRYIARRHETSQTARVDANVRRRVCGVIWAIGWECLRSMLSPRLAALHHSTFVFDEPLQSTVELDKHRSASNLDELDLDDPQADKAA